MMTTGGLLGHAASWTFPKSASAVSPFTLLHDAGHIILTDRGTCYYQAAHWQQRYSSQPHLYLFCNIISENAADVNRLSKVFEKNRYFINLIKN